MALAGLFSAMKITKQQLENQRVVLLGAGEAGIGIANAITAALVDRGNAENEARKHCWLVDSKGLVCKERNDLKDHKLRYAHEHPKQSSLLDVIHELKPTALIGVSGQPNQFNEEVIQVMSRYNERPIIFALSNPTSKSECTAAHAYQWSDGKAIFASGSPFDPVKYKDSMYYPGQGNNVYIFPGIGLGVLYSHASRVNDRMFLEAARVLSDCISEEELERGQIYPSVENIREVSARIAEAVTRVAIEDRLSEKPLPENILDDIKAQMYTPEYLEFL